MTFEIDENGKPVPNAYVPCDGCGEVQPLVILKGDGLEIARDPTIRVLCARCWAVEGAEAITAASNEEQSS